MIRKVFCSFVLIGVISCFLLTYCSGEGKYGEVKKVLNDYIDSSEKLYKALDKAKDGKAVAKAFREYAKEMKVLSPKLEALPEKYPELKDSPPEEINDLMEKFEASMGGMAKVMEKVMKYMDDPEVKEVLEELREL